MAKLAKRRTRRGGQAAIGPLRQFQEPAIATCAATPFAAATRQIPRVIPLTGAQARRQLSRPDNEVTFELAPSVFTSGGVTWKAHPCDLPPRRRFGRPRDGRHPRTSVRHSLASSATLAGISLCLRAPRQAGRHREFEDPAPSSGSSLGEIGRGGVGRLACACGDGREEGGGGAVHAGACARGAELTPVAHPFVRHGKISTSLHPH